MKRTSLSKAQQGFAVLEVALIIVVIAGVVGIGTFVYKQRTKQSANISSGTTAEEVEPLAEDLDAVLGFEDVKKIALKENADDQIVDIDLETEDGTMIFIVKLKSGKKLYIDAKSAAIVKTENGTPSSEAALPSDLGSLISVSKAREIALAKNPGGKIIKIELEMDDGKWEYEVKFVGGLKVEVDASSGNVTKVKQEDKEDKKDTEDKNDDSDDDKKESSNKSSDDDDDKDDDKEDDDDGNDADNSDDDEDEEDEIDEEDDSNEEDDN